MTTASLPRLDYFAEYPLGATVTGHTRNVQLRPGRVSNLREREQFFIGDNMCWKIARKLEGRESASKAEGVWPVNHWRAQRRIGRPGRDVFPTELSLEEAPADVFLQAKEMRLLSYCRVRNTPDAIEVVRNRQDVRLSVNLTHGWYDPTDGRIPYEPEAIVCGAHNIPLAAYDENERMFLFPNSWGTQWGHNGWGALPLDSFQNQSNEAWLVAPDGLFPPHSVRSGIACCEWKWSLTPDLGVHCREIIDGKTLDRLAWAFCVKRNGFLEIDDFYVWPSERGKGYGRVLAAMVTRLGSQVSAPLRMLVSYADAAPRELDLAQAAAKLLGLNLCESDAWDVPLVGEKTPQPSTRAKKPPQRPAFLLELLRSKDEAAILCPPYDIVFGTNRSPVHTADLVTGFGSTRAPCLLVGTASVEVGATPTFGSFGRAWRSAIGALPKSSPSLFVADDPLPLYSRCQQEDLRNVGLRFNFLFVHGFNVSFKAAVERGGRLGAALKVLGTTYVYSWPASINYLADEAAVEASLPYFSAFVNNSIQHSGSLPLMVVAHSMGNRLLLRYLLELVKADPAAAERISQIVFAAPDVDHEVFARAMHELRDAPFRKTLYAARGDAALKLSELGHGYARAGFAPPVVTADGLDTVLVEGGPVFNMGHAYYGDQSDLLHDLFQLFHFSAEPNGRRSPKPTITEDCRVYWKIDL